MRADTFEPTPSNASADLACCCPCVFNDGQTTEPIRNTAAYESLADTIVDALDDSGATTHTGFGEKELRRRRQQLRLAKAGQGSRAGKIGRVKVPQWWYTSSPHVNKHGRT